MSCINPLNIAVEFPSSANQEMYSSMVKKIFFRYSKIFVSSVWSESERKINSPLTIQVK